MWAMAGHTRICRLCARAAANTTTAAANVLCDVAGNFAAVSSGLRHRTWHTQPCRAVRSLSQRRAVGDALARGNRGFAHVGGDAFGVPGAGGGPALTRHAVCEDAAAFFDPLAPVYFAEKVTQLLADTKWRAELIDRGCALVRRRENRPDTHRAMLEKVVEVTEAKQNRTAVEQRDV